MIYYIYDIETGYPTQVTKEQKEAYLKMIESATPKLTDRVKGTITIFGTGGDFEKQGDLKLLFNKPESYGICR